MARLKQMSEASAHLLLGHPEAAKRHSLTPRITELTAQHFAALHLG